MTRLNIDWDSLITSAPQNRQAACDASAKGEGFTPFRKRYHGAHSDVPLPTAPFKGPKDQDLTGQSFGRFRVIGKSPQESASKKQKPWVVRCSCGAYEHRYGPALKKAAETGDRCQDCRSLQHIQHEDRRRQTAEGKSMPLRVNGQDRASVFDKGEA